MSSIQTPTCPACKAEMKPYYYVGYYEEFSCWRCECEVTPGSVVLAGGWSSGTDGMPAEDYLALE